MCISVAWYLLFIVYDTYSIYFLTHLSTRLRGFKSCIVFWFKESHRPGLDSPKTGCKISLVITKCLRCNMDNCASLI